MITRLCAFFSLFILSSFCLSQEDIPEFKGGQQGLSAFLARSIIYPEYAKANCLQGTIQVSFLLNSKGKITRSKIEKGLGIDLDDEALRVVRLTSGKWKVPLAFDTTQYITIPINFSLKEFGCENKSRDEISEAINAYRARQDLIQAVIHFYQHKGEPGFDAHAEAKILEIKEQLGLDDKFEDRLLKQANQKLKQGDKEGACEDLHLIKNLGSDKANPWIEKYCR